MDGRREGESGERGRKKEEIKVEKEEGGGKGEGGRRTEDEVKGWKVEGGNKGEEIR